MKEEPIIDKEISELMESLEKNPDSLLTFKNEVQLRAQQNKKNPNEIIFIREDGKIGFPTFNSIQIKVGDVVKGVIKLDAPNHFMVQVNKILSSEQSTTTT